jgi:hypothetical protein
MRAMRRPRLVAGVWVAAVGFVVGIAYRAFIDDATTHEFAHFVRSGLHGVGIAVAGWTVQSGFAANARSSFAAALRRLPMAAEIVVRSVVMTVVIVVAGEFFRWYFTPNRSRCIGSQRTGSPPRSHASSQSGSQSP